MKIISGDKGYLSIKVNYIATTSYTFSVEIDFGREPIQMFTAEIGVPRELAMKYFGGMDVSKKLRVDVNPAFMSVYRGEGDD